MRIILGTMTFGKQVNKKNAQYMVNLFIDHGYNEIDTAYRYGGGITEEILGKILIPSKRKKVYLATKVTPSDGRSLKPEQITEQLETSLKRLKTEYVDLLYLHAPDNKTAIELTLETCEKHLQQGKFIEFGVSNYASWQVADLYHIAERNCWVKPIVYQGRYNSITRNIEPELIPVLRKFKIRFYAYNPLAGGLLTGKHNNPTMIPKEGRFSIFKTYVNRYWKERYFNAINEIKGVCDFHNITPSEAALRWLIHHSKLEANDQDGIIIGASKIEQLKENLKVCKEGKLPKEIVLAYEKAWEITRCDSPKYFRD